MISLSLCVFIYVYKELWSLLLRIYAKTSIQNNESESESEAKATKHIACEHCFKKTHSRTRNNNNKNVIGIKTISISFSLFLTLIISALLLLFIYSVYALTLAHMMIKVHALYTIAKNECIY